MKLNTFFQKHKKPVLIALAIFVLVGVGCGIWYYIGHSNTEPVYVYPFHYIGMTEYWGDSRESYGPITTDKIQTVFLSDTQTVTEILVETGDVVKKGDLLLSFDTTLSDLQLERKRLDVEKLKLQLENARKELNRINSLEPMVIPTYEEVEEDPYLGRLIQGDYEISTNKVYDGSSAYKAIICWINSQTEITDAVFLAIQDKASYYQFKNQPEEEPEADGSDENAGDGSSSSTSEEQYPLVSSFYVVFKVTSGNMSLGDKVVWQCVNVTEHSDGFTFRFVNTVVEDHMLVDLGGEASDDDYEIDYGSGYTAAQIAQMRSDQQKKIKDLEFQVKMAEADYQIMLTEFDDGNVYAKIDGEVISVLTEEEAKKTKQPVLKVSGGGGFYVEGYVSELEKDTIQPGQEVTINDWNSGMTHVGTIQSIGDFPKDQSHFSGNGNPNASFYSFTVFVEGDADLQAGTYVSVVYSSAESENGIYLENPFLRKEQGKTYVLVQGAEGKLEQRFVTTGKSLWGNYTQILEGLTAEDLIAFPYGKQVKPGADTVEGDLSNLYG